MTEQQNQHGRYMLVEYLLTSVSNTAIVDMDDKASIMHAAASFTVQKKTDVFLFLTFFSILFFFSQSNALIEYYFSSISPSAYHTLRNRNRNFVKFLKGSALALFPTFDANVADK